jgi:hypothetical protein
MSETKQVVIKDYHRAGGVAQVGEEGKGIFPGAGGVAQVTERLPSKHETLSLNPYTAQKKKKENHKQKKTFPSLTSININKVSTYAPIP